MKKIISVLVLVTLLIGCVAPALVSNADAAVSVAFPAKNEIIADGSSKQYAVNGTLPTTADAAYVGIVLCWDSSENIEEIGLKLDTTVFDSDLSVTEAPKAASTLKNSNPLKDLLKDNGIDLSATTYAVVGLNAASGTTLPDTAAFSVVFGFASAPQADDEFDVKAIVYEAYDSSDGELTPSENVASFNVKFLADPLSGIFEDFTAFFCADGDTVTKETTKVAHDVAYGSETVDVYLRLDASEGPWAVAFCVLYPTAWSLKSYENGTVYPEKCFQTKIVNSQPKVAVEETGATFKNTCQQFGLTSEDLEGLSYIKLFYNDANDPNYRTFANGVLTKLTFNVPSGAKVGDTATITTIYNRDKGDCMCRDENDQIVVLKPTVIPMELTLVCNHPTTHKDHKDPSCVPGYDADKCDTCGELLNKVDINPTGEHVYDESEGEGVYTPATCTEGAYTTYTCINCGEATKTVDDLEHQELGHDLDDGTYLEGDAPTCLAGGTLTKSCQREGCTYTEQSGVDPLGHLADEANQVITPATCTSPKHIYIPCQRCELPYKDEDEGDMLGHDYEGGVSIIAATCTEDGYTLHECQRSGCGYSYTSDTVPKLNHHLVDDPEVAPTCTETGLTAGKHCDRQGCGYVEIPQTTVPSTGHHFEKDTIVSYDATYDADGFYAERCTNINGGEQCTETQSARVLPRLTITATFNCVDEDGNPITTVTKEGLYNFEFLSANLPAVPGYEIVMPEDFDYEETFTANVTEYTFTYAKRTDIEYKVMFVDEEGKEIADAKVVAEQTFGEEVTENAIVIEGYTLKGEATQKLVLGAEDNVITFTYAKNETKAPEQKPSSPKTGDPMMYIIIALAVAVAGTVAVVVIRRRKED